MSLIKKITYIFDRKQKRQLFFLCICILLGTVFELLGVTAILPFVNVILSPETAINQKYLRVIYDLFRFKSSNSFLIFLAVVLIVIFIIKNAYLAFLYHLQYKFTGDNQRRLSTRMFNCYLQQPYLFFTNHNSADLVRNVGMDTITFYKAVLAALQIITEVSVCVVLGIFLFFTDKSITLGVLFMLVVMMVLFMKKYKKKLKDLGEATRYYHGSFNKWMLQGFGGIKEIQIMNKEQFFIDFFDKEYEGYADANRKYNFLAALPKLMMETLCISSLLGVICIKLFMGVNSEYFIPTISVFAVAAFRMLPSFNKITLNLSTLIFSKASVDAVYRDLKEIDSLTIQDKGEKDDAKYKIKSLKKGITVKDLSFKYPEGDSYVLNNATLHIPKNQSVAFIGPSGSGKTTLADIILGVMEPDKGHILADDINIHENLYEWHKMVGYIPQSIYLIDDNIRNNIAFGVPEKEIDENRVWQVLEDAQLKEYVQSLEEGLDTEIGERGIRLSGGQRQRIGIARALYHNPEILVLDEATSALDNDTESAVMDAINKLAGTKTMIIIAHRLSTIEKCDVIYEIKDGTVLKKDS